MHVIIKQVDIPYFENPTIGLHYMFYMFLTCMPIFISIGCFLHYFKLQKLKFKLLIDDIVIDFFITLKFCKRGEYRKIM